MQPNQMLVLESFLVKRCLDAETDAVDNIHARVRAARLIYVRECAAAESFIGVFIARARTYDVETALSKMLVVDWAAGTSLIKAYLCMRRIIALEKNIDTAVVFT